MDQVVTSKPFRAVIFDFDGTLVDSYEAHLESFRRALSKFGLKVEDKEIYRRFGKAARQMLVEVLPEKEHPHISEMVREKRNQFVETSLNVRVFEGVEDVLRFLKNGGVKVGLATSADRPSVVRVLERANLADYFDVIVSAEDVKEAKPNPRVFTLTVERLGSRPEECLAVGDSIFDVIAARNAGIRIVVFANNPYQIDEIKSQEVSIVSKIDEIKRFF